jgi:Fuc2NAc and GlcNAc transferase
MTQFDWERAGALVVAWVVALGLTPLVRRLASRSGLLDRPNPRSSHTRVTPRGGGLAILGAVTATLVILPGAGEVHAAEGALLAGVGILALTGLVDDRFGLAPAVRLTIQFAVAIGLVSVTGGIPALPLPPPLDVPLGPLAEPVAVLWLVAVTNFFNFLDGIDGLASAQAVITGLGVAWAAWDPFAARLAAALAGGSAGFLPFNWAPARIFLGDVGSLTLGYTLASLPLLASRGARSSVVFWTAMSLWLFLADAAWTVVRRVSRGERCFEAHRGHLYQRLVASGMTHAQVSGLIAVGSAVLTLAALLALGSTASGPAWIVVTLALGLFLVEVKAAARRPRVDGAGA